MYICVVSNLNIEMTEFMTGNICLISQESFSAAPVQIKAGDIFLLKIDKLDFLVDVARML